MGLPVLHMVYMLLLVSVELLLIVPAAVEAAA